MSLVSSILLGLRAYKQERDRLAGVGESGAEKPVKLNFGSGLSFGDPDELMRGIQGIGANAMKGLPRIQEGSVGANPFPIYKPKTQANQ
jgi:hypothetical protein